MKKVNWLDHIANLLVVILGISIAFYLEGYRAEKELKIQEEKYLESLISDLENDITSIDTLVSLNKNISRALVALSDASIGMPRSEDTTIVSRVMWIQFNPPFTPQNTTYESLKASGKMDLIGDFELRNKIVELYEQSYLYAYQYDESLSEHVSDYIKPFFMKNMKYISRNEIDDAFLNDNEFRNMIFAYRFLFQQKNSYYKTVREIALEVKSALEASIES